MKKILFLLFLLLPNIIFANELINMKIIAKIESNNNPFAYNHKSKAIGIYQITSICLEDYNNYHNKKYKIIDLFNPKINYEVAYWYLNIRIPQMLKYFKIKDTIKNRLICYNAGINYLMKNKFLPKETINYIEKYFKLQRK